MTTLWIQHSIEPRVHTFICCKKFNILFVEYDIKNPSLVVLKQIKTIIQIISLSFSD